MPTIRVKRASIIQSLAVSILTGLGLLVLWALMDDEDALVNHFGTTLAASLASQAIEPILARDLIHLGVLTNRTAGLPEVTGASVHGMGSEPLALAGDVRRGRIFTSQVVHNERSLGVVRVHLDPAAFATGPPALLLLTGALWVAAAPFLVLLGANLRRPAFTGNIVQPAERTPARPEPVAEPEAWCLICVNLFNQLSLAPAQCQRELDYARRVARRVAALYSGEVRNLPGTGLQVAFRPGGSDDRPFHALCAAFILSKLLADGESFGRYRLSLHTLMVEAGAEPGPDLEAVCDAAVLSALARDNGLVVSEAFFTQLPYNQRLVSQPLDHPLLEDLATSGGGAHLAMHLADPHRDLIEERLAEITGQEDAGPSVSRESTF